MTLDEFLDEFIQKAGMPRSARTADGISYGSFRRVAVACSMGQEPHWHTDPATLMPIRCNGWQLIVPPDTPKYRGGEYKVTRHV